VDQSPARAKPTPPPISASSRPSAPVEWRQPTRAFLDEALVDLDASREADGEARRKAVGLIEGRIFTLVYVQRKEAIRIISARRANATERKAYGQI
jgi:uncharacterized DUF497 family protein